MQSINIYICTHISLFIYMIPKNIIHLCRSDNIPWYSIYFHLFPKISDILISDILTKISDNIPSTNNIPMFFFKLYRSHYSSHIFPINNIPQRSKPQPSQATEVQVMDVLESFCFLRRSKWDASGWWKMWKLANNIWHNVKHGNFSHFFFHIFSPKSWSISLTPKRERTFDTSSSVNWLDSLHGSDSLGNQPVDHPQCHQGAPRWRFLGSRANPPGAEHFGLLWNMFLIKPEINIHWNNLNKQSVEKQPIAMFLWTLGHSISQFWWDYNLCRLPIPIFLAGIPKRISESGFPLLSRFSLVTSK